MNARLWMTAGLLAVSVAAVAAPKQDEGKLGFDPAIFAEQRRSLELELETGERYREIVGEDREAVSAALVRLSEHLGKVNSINQLDEKAKLQVFNDQELVNNILTRAAADSRMICKRETPTGSRMPVNICKTVAQRRRDHDAARNMMTGAQQRSNMKPPAGG